MLFIAAPFLIYFLPITLIGFHLLGRAHRKAAILWLVLASLTFYGYWNPKYVLLLFGSMLVNFVISRAIARATASNQKNAWMILGIILNLGALCYFKYLFSFLSFLHDVHVIAHDWTSVILPLGISFFTFTQIGYLVDLAQGEATPEDFTDYALFVTFFPHLIAGPLLHHKEIMPQIAGAKHLRLHHQDVLLGLSWFVLGLAKKLIIADYFARPANLAFGNVGLLTAKSAWLGLLCYSMQLYFDFSGYSDMAIGLARMFSIRFPMNFNSPFQASGIIDFWQRWHMTLTRYITLYLYNPISIYISRRRMAKGMKVSRKAARTPSGFLAMIAWPTIATMFVAGVWHGAGLQFVLFGVLHGIYLCVNHAWRLFRPEHGILVKYRLLARTTSILLTYLCVIIALVFFRANSTSEAFSFITRLVRFQPSAADGLLPVTSWLVLVLFPVVWFLPNTQQIMGQVEAVAKPGTVRSWLTWQPSLAWSVAIGLLFFVSLLFASTSASFLYFQF
jgi:alginate O-acetyltransferase complex protein AlgI